MNDEYRRFAEHYGAAAVPARVRRPRDKAVAESTVDLVEKWIIAPSDEMTFYSLEEFNGFCLERVRWLNARPFSAKEGSRDSVYEDEERACMQPLPSERYEMCEWRSREVAPDYHVTVDYVRYSVPSRPVGEQVDVRPSDSRVTVMSGGGAVADIWLHGAQKAAEDKGREQYAQKDCQQVDALLAGWFLLVCHKNTSVM